MVSASGSQLLSTEMHIRRSMNRYEYLRSRRKPQPAEENGLSSSECNQPLDLQKLSRAKWDKASEGPKSAREDCRRTVRCGGGRRRGREGEWGRLYQQYSSNKHRRQTCHNRHPPSPQQQEYFNSKSTQDFFATTDSNRHHSKVRTSSYFALNSIFSCR